MALQVQAGLRKPGGRLMGPIFPEIKRAEESSRAKWSGKYRRVDIGDIEAGRMLTANEQNMMLHNVVLVQDRAHNQTRYGQSSHKTVINGSFRPPLRDMIYENYALNRIPVSSTTIMPITNPDGTHVYVHRQSQDNERTSAMTDDGLLEDVSVTSGYVAHHLGGERFSRTVDNGVAVASRVKESYSVAPHIEKHATFSLPTGISMASNASVVLPTLREAHKPEIEVVTAKYGGGVRVDGNVDTNRVQTVDGLRYATTSGTRTAYTSPNAEDIETPIHLIDAPVSQAGASSGSKAVPVYDGNHDTEREQSMMQDKMEVAVSANATTPYRSLNNNARIPMREKLYVNPEISNQGYRPRTGITHLAYELKGK